MITQNLLKSLYSKYIRKDKKYIIGDYKVLLPSNHLLPYYKSEHRLYDVFLGYLASCLPANTYAIDVGANCGDTLALMASKNKEIDFLCIEADEVFFSYLQSNSNQIEHTTKKEILNVNSLAGTLEDKVIMKEVVPGTKRAVKANDNENGITSKPLDEIISDNITKKEFKISLIKTDTDGYDYDVINSAQRYVDEFKPILFFECFFAYDWQKDEYKKLIERIHASEYSNFYIFDNFGAYIFKTSCYLQIIDFFEYNFDQSMNRTTKTIQYIDVVACTEADELVVEDALEKFMRHTRYE